MAADALVALTILASTLVFALVAAHQAVRAAQLGLETRRATQDLAFLLDTTRRASGLTEGRTRQFAWRLSVDDPLPSAAAATLCAHSLVLTSLRTARTYGARTNEICPAAATP